jgi:hypothetical protein
MLTDKDVFVTPDGYLALIIPDDPTLREFVISDVTKITLGIDLIQSGQDGLLAKIRYQENVIDSLRDNIADLERELDELKEAKE